MGCERESAMEGLSDHLLALRAVLEGHGPVGASLPMRASALIADENFDRIEARERVEEVLELERALMNGRTLDRAIELATWIEDGVRRLLRQAALGELGADLATTADETLIATGLEAGDAEITVFAEDDSRRRGGPRASRGAALAERVPRRRGPPRRVDEPDRGGRRSTTARRRHPRSRELPGDDEPDSSTRRTNAWTPASSSRSRPKARSRSPRPPGSTRSPRSSAATHSSGRAHEERDLQHRERIDTPRVRHLFPVPDSDWEVSHLEFDYHCRRPTRLQRQARPAAIATRSSPVANR